VSLRSGVVRVSVRWLLLTFVLVMALGAGQAYADPNVTISAVAGTFYPNPSDSGSFDASQLGSPAFTQDFSTIDFNPPASAQVACSNNTGVNEFTRPFTAVLPQADGSCTTVVAQGNGQQAGVGNLSSFEAVFQSNLYIDQPASVTFNFFSDDGWTLGIGKEVISGATPSYVSGQLTNPPASTPVDHYPVLGALNAPSSPTQAQVTVNFPAAGTYPIEVDYTECCGGQLALTMGTTAGNPIPPAGSQGGGCATTPASSSLDDQLAAIVCKFAADEQPIVQHASNVQTAMAALPIVSQTGPQQWTVPATGTIGTQTVDTMKSEADLTVDATQASAGDLTDNATTQTLKAVAGGQIPCATDLAKSLYDAMNSDNEAISDLEKAIQTAHDLETGKLTSAASYEVVGYDILAMHALSDKLQSLADALVKVYTACEQDRPTLSEQLTEAAAELSSEKSALDGAVQNLSLVSPGGSIMVMPFGGLTGLSALVDPPAFPLVGDQRPFGVPSGDTIVPGSLSGLTATPLSGLTAGGTLSLGGSGFQPGSPVMVLVASSPTVLAQLTADQSGGFATTAQLPSTLATGDHELFAVGTDPNGKLYALGATVSVTAAKNPPSPSTCAGTLSGTINGSLTIAAGIPCTLSDATVNGTVTVSQGAILDAESSTLNGGVTASSPLAIVLCGDQVNGSVSVSASTIAPVIGGTYTPDCASTAITGQTTIQ
jgi:hypothetical protein